MLSRKIFVLTAAFFAIFLFGQTLCEAQSKKSSSLYAKPSRLMLKGDENEVKEEETGQLLREKFYPIGWSKDGKFAFLVEPPDEACGCYFAHLVIQDLLTDKILWERKYEGEEAVEETLQNYRRCKITGKKIRRSFPASLSNTELSRKSASLYKILLSFIRKTR
jgi:hypothetical protein